MENIDYSNIKVVGIVELQPWTNHCVIKLVGYLKAGSWTFESFDQKDAKEIFPSRGCVFAPNFKDRFPNLIGKCIYAGIQDSNNNGPDEYIWDRDAGRPEEYGTVIVNGILGDINPKNQNQTFSFLQNKNILGCSDIQFYKINNTLYVIEPTAAKDMYIYSVEMDKAIKEQPNSFGTFDGIHYAYIKGDFKGARKYIDIMPEDKLLNWFVKYFFAKEWDNFNNYSSQEDFIRYFTPLFEKAKLPRDVISTRVDRIFKSLDSLNFTYTQLLQLYQLQEFRSCIEKSVELNFDKYLEKTKTEHNAELKHLEDSYNSELSDIKEKIERIRANQDTQIASINEEFESIKKEKTSELTLFDKKISEKQEEINFIESQILAQQSKLELLKKEKNRLLEDFNIVKDIVGMLNISNSEKPDNPADNKCSECLMLLSETIACNDYTDCIKRLEFFLEKNNRKPDIAKRLFGYLTYYEVLLLPDFRIANAIIQSTGKCVYNIQYVTPELRDFNTIWNNGLNNLITSANDNVDVMHYCILQNINTSYIPCFMQPIIDMIIGLRQFFPNTKLSIPNNLRFILTTTKDEGIPLSEQSIKYFGCLDNIDYTIDEQNETKYSIKDVNIQGALTPSHLEDFNKNTFLPPKSDYISFINR